ncbi:hypothetical protein BaRGS_00040519 [Batillaria attramentaria]|uniref:Uncharacterized protein n=1 Tax=Batillaria attramentaria TaxID=370345 RepID=A0ABD0IZZ4_9CAEN
MDESAEEAKTMAVGQFPELGWICVLCPFLFYFLPVCDTKQRERQVVLSRIFPDFWTSSSGVEEEGRWGLEGDEHEKGGSVHTRACRNASVPDLLSGQDENFQLLKFDSFLPAKLTFRFFWKGRMLCQASSQRHTEALQREGRRQGVKRLREVLPRILGVFGTVAKFQYDDGTLSRELTSNTGDVVDQNVQPAPVAHMSPTVCARAARHAAPERSPGAVFSKLAAPADTRSSADVGVWPLSVS